MKCVVFAYHDFGVAGLASLASLAHMGVRIERIFTHADQPHEKVWWASVAGWAAEHGVPCELDADLKDPRVQAQIRSDAPDLILSFYFRKMIPTAVLELAPVGAVNLHGSLLPKFRGRSPVNWQLVHGVERSGLTLHRMVRQADAGEIIAQQAVDVHPDQDALGLTRQLLAIAPRFLDSALADLVAQRVHPIAQDATQATYFGGRTPADGMIDWRCSAREIHNLVRAVAPPWPGAFTTLAGRTLIVRRSAVAHESSRYGEPGMVLGNGTIACGAGRLALLSLAWVDDEAPVALVPGVRLMPPPST